MVFDAIAMKFSEVGLARSSDRAEVSELIDYQGFCAGPKVAEKQPAAAAGGGRTMDEALADEGGPPQGGDGFNTITPSECLERLSGGWSPWVLDVRLKSENDIVALPFTDAVVPHRTVRPDHVPRDGDVLVYCKAGVRGKKACSRLVELGVDARRLYNLEGGILGWQSSVDPRMPRY